jgi:hypothetical protein
VLTLLFEFMIIYQVIQQLFVSSCEADSKRDILYESYDVTER